MKWFACALFAVCVAAFARGDSPNDYYLPKEWVGGEAGVAELSISGFNYWIAVDYDGEFNGDDWDTLLNRYKNNTAALTALEALYQALKAQAMTDNLANTLYDMANGGLTVSYFDGKETKLATVAYNGGKNANKSKGKTISSEVKISPKIDCVSIKSYSDGSLYTMMFNEKSFDDGPLDPSGAPTAILKGQDNSSVANDSLAHVLSFGDTGGYQNYSVPFRAGVGGDLQWIKVGNFVPLVEADGLSIVTNETTRAGELSIRGFTDADEGTMPKKVGDHIEWTTASVEADNVSIVTNDGQLAINGVDEAAENTVPVWNGAGFDWYEAAYAELSGEQLTIHSSHPDYSSVDVEATLPKITRDERMLTAAWDYGSSATETWLDNRWNFGNLFLYTTPIAQGVTRITARMEYTKQDGSSATYETQPCDISGAIAASVATDNKSLDAQGKVPGVATNVYTALELKGFRTRSHCTETATGLMTGSTEDDTHEIVCRVNHSDGTDELHYLPIGLPIKGDDKSVEITSGSTAREISLKGFDNAGGSATDPKLASNVGGANLAWTSASSLADNSTIKFNESGKFAIKPGASGKFLQSTADGVAWVDAPSGGIGQIAVKGTSGGFVYGTNIVFDADSNITIIPTAENGGIKITIGVTYK